uniref:Uncharacterized protein n=1 Tax=Ditylenchus dipsaci TaxID=166011 RepID=A0A915D429_9BILA
MTLELRNALEQSQVQMVDLMKPLLLQMCGQGGMLEQNSSVVDCVCRGSPDEYLKHSLENLLLMGPPLSPAKLLDHLRWAKSTILKNLLRTTLFRIEEEVFFIASAVGGQLSETIVCAKICQLEMRLRRIKSSAGDQSFEWTRMSCTLCLKPTIMPSR